MSKKFAMPLLSSSVSPLLWSRVPAAIILLSSFTVGSAAQDQAKTEDGSKSKTTTSGASIPEKPDLETATGGDSTLRLGIGDLVDVSVYNVPELTTKVRVSNGGDVYLPLIDYVHVAGLTTEEAQSLIEKRLTDGGFLKNPHVAVFVNEYASQGASVLGEVTKPGVYPVLGEQRLFDLISAAGGSTERAGRSVTVTHRNQSDKPVTVPLARNITDNPDNNVEVFPGDTVIVRKADIVYVVGDVTQRLPDGFGEPDGA